MNKLILRLDDITENMNWSRFYELESLLDRFSVKPIIGVIPLNRDKSFNKYPSIPKSAFKEKIYDLHKKGWIIAQHGTYHSYHRDSTDILRINDKSEFSGLSYVEQLNLLNKGKVELESIGLKIRMFMAPSHSFDKNTVQALMDLGFEYITDGFHWKLYRYSNITFIPQLFASFWHIKYFGVWTVCLHINSYSDKEWRRIKLKIVENRRNFISPEQLYSLPRQQVHFAGGLRTVKYIIKMARYVKCKLRYIKIPKA